eukprot:Mrub_02600.p1 GENE.Mrub_02600~~Mrub_02600.p1  ORF type:complete len:526 (+),score=142.17 Mrub_02600:69-1580(+)
MNKSPQITPKKDEKTQKDYQELDDYIKKVKSDIGMHSTSKFNQPIKRSKSAVSLKPNLMQPNEPDFQMSRTQELNENNFIKKMKTLSKTSVDITVKSLKPPKIKTDIYSVDPLRMLAKSGSSQVPATRYERTDQLNFIKSREHTREYHLDLLDEQAKNAHYEYDNNKVKWNHNFIQDQISGVNELLHHTGIATARTKTMKLEDVTNGIADLYGTQNFKIIQKQNPQLFNQFSFQSKLDKFYADEQYKNSNRTIDELKTAGLSKYKEEYEKTRVDLNRTAGSSIFRESQLLSGYLNNPSTYTQLLYNIPASDFVYYVGEENNPQSNYEYPMDKSDVRSQFFNTCKTTLKNEKDYMDFTKKINNKTINNINNWTQSNKDGTKSNKYYESKKVGEYDLANTKYKYLEHERNDMKSWSKGNLVLKSRYMEKTHRLKTTSPIMMSRKEDMYSEEYNPHAINYVKYLKNCFGKDEGVNKRGFSSYYNLRPELMTLKKDDLNNFRKKINL